MQSWKRNFYLVWANNFVTGVGMMAFIPLFPLYLRELGVTDPGAVSAWAGVIFAGAPLTAACMGPLWGALGDRVGRKPMMLRANLSIALFVGSMAFAGSPLQLLLLRLGQGFFSGFMAPSVTLVSVATPMERQGRVMGLLHTALLAGGIVGPLLGGYVADNFGLRWVFAVTSCLSLLAATMTALFVREVPHDAAAASPDRGPSADAADPAGEQPAPAPRPRLTLGSLLRGAWSDIGVLVRTGPLRSILVVVFAVRFGAALIDPILALYVETLEGFDADRLATTAGFVFGLTSVAALIFTPVWGRVGDSLGASRALGICATGAGLAYLAQAFVTHVDALAALRFLSGSFVAGIFPAAYAATARHSSVERRGSAYGVTFSSLIFANALGPASGGLLAARFGLRRVMLLASLLMLGAALHVIVRSIRRRRRGAAPPRGSGSLHPQQNPGAP